MRLSLGWIDHNKTVAQRVLRHGLSLESLGAHHTPKYSHASSEVIVRESCNTTKDVIAIDGVRKLDLHDGVKMKSNRAIETSLSHDRNVKSTLDISDRKIFKDEVQSHLVENKFISVTSESEKTTGTILKKRLGNNNKSDDNKVFNDRKKINVEKEENLPKGQRKLKTIKDIFDALEKKNSDKKDTLENVINLEYPKLEPKENFVNDNIQENCIEKERKLDEKSKENSTRKENWLQKLQREKLQKKIEGKKKKENSTINRQKIIRKKIPQILDAENYKTEEIEDKKRTELERLFEKMKEKENYEPSENKKIITPIKKKITVQKRLGRSPGVKCRNVKDMIRTFEEREAKK